MYEHQISRVKLHVCILLTIKSQEEEEMKTGCFFFGL